jgi:hypothetical protein
VSAPTRQWTGRLWANRVTVDRRSVITGAITMPVSVPLMMRSEVDGDRTQVGEVIHVVELSGLGLGVGWTTLEPGIYPVAIQLTNVVTDVPEEGESICVVRSGVLQEATIMAEGDTAWSDAAIMVHPDLVWP